MCFFSKKPETAEEHVKMIYEFIELVETESRLNGYVLTDEDQIHLFQNCFIDEWDD